MSTPPHSAPAPSPAQVAVSARLRRRRLLLSVLLVAYGLLLAALSLANANGPDRWWWSSLNLYLPQWIWTLPGICLLPLTFALHRRRVCLPLFLLLWAAGPLMGFCGHLPRLDANGSRPLHLRVMTYNIKGDIRDSDAITRELEETRPDLVLLQEAHSKVEARFRNPAGWNVARAGEVMIATRFPILSSEPLQFTGPHGEGILCLRARIRVGGGAVTVYTTHLLTPRGGLSLLRHRREEGIDGFQANISYRLVQSSLIADALRQEKGPLLLTGDLNAPVQSLVCRQLFATGLRDAFSDAGWGYGYSYGQFQKLRHPYLRIDHILVSDQFRVERCWPGNKAGSDHRPVFADLTL